MRRTSLWSVSTWLFIDLLTALVFIFMSLSLVEPGKMAADPHKQIGALTIELYWDLKDGADVDLWAQAPGDRPVGYSSKEGTILSLLRDDLGLGYSTDSRNYEITQAFGIHPGEYVVNAFLYRYRSGPEPIKVHMVVSRREENGDTIELLVRDGALVNDGDELTLARFSLDKDGHVIPGSVNALPKPLRAAQ